MSSCYMEALMHAASAADSGPASDGWFAAEPGQGSSSRERETIIIACTADSDIPPEALHEAGVHDILTKPVRE
jgi:CheY-like chemotaxis protein